ncbi:MAG: LysM peptidoglycan-binding domain-containing protein [Myxococcales bacterium]|nr:LysM peptidoglycan-binding domain-containing protein [Myxococcales bacterium]
MRQWTRATAWALVASIATGPVCACDGGALEEIPRAMLAAGAGTAGKTTLVNVVPSRPPRQLHTVTVEEERYLGDMARALGVTVDSVLADNGMQEPTLKPGMVLQVRTTRDLIDAFVARRDRRKAEKAAAEEAKRQAKLKADADARAARRLARMQARRKRAGRGVEAKASAAGVTAPAAGARDLSHGRHKVSVVLAPGDPWAAPSPR